MDNYYYTGVLFAVSDIYLKLSVLDNRSQRIVALINSYHSLLHILRYDILDVDKRSRSGVRKRMLNRN